MTTTLDDAKVELLRQKIEEKRESLKNPEQLFSAFSVDQEKTEEYNGRQLLELIQNAVDAGANTVTICLKTKENLLEISDSGLSFSVEGIRSLMYPGRSPKRSGSFIGNKGLGFRSLLNWADCITIGTEVGTVEFSSELAKAFFNETFKDPLEREALLTQNGYPKDFIPVPVLGVPEFTPGIVEKTIRIHYREEFEKDIIAQLKSVDDRTILFLRELETVWIEIDGDKRTISRHMVVHRTEEWDKGVSYEEVSIGGKTWYTYSISGILEPEYCDPKRTGEQSYSVTVALCGDMEENRPDGVLYNFFPTLVSVPLPCTIHATVELNDSRNHLKPNYPANEYIISQLLGLLKLCSEQKVGADINRWLPFRILAPDRFPENPCLNMNKGLAEAREQLPVLPVMGNNYVREAEAFFYDNNDSAFWDEKGIVIKDLLIPVPKEVEKYYVQKHAYDLGDFIRLLNESAENISMDLELRAAIVHELWRIFPGNDATDVKAALLFDSEKHSIGEDADAYTPPESEDASIQTPDSIRIIDKDLYQNLLAAFKDQIDRSSQVRSRALVEQLSRFVNIHPYDSAAINEKIITETNAKLGQGGDDVQFVMDMVRKLIFNYLASSKRKEEIKEYKGPVSLLDENGCVRQADDMLLPLEGFPNYSAKDYLLPFEKWGLESPQEKANSFFKWLGVNEFVKIERLEGKNPNWKGNEDYILNKDIINYEEERIESYSLYKIKGFPETYQEWAPDDILHAFSLSPAIMDALSNDGKKRKDTFVVNWYGLRNASPAMSLIEWQLKNWTDGNPFRGKLYRECVQDPSSLDDAKKLVLKAFGAYGRFEDMPVDSMYDYLVRLGNEYEVAPEGIQQVYSSVLDALNKKVVDNPVRVREDLKLFVRGGQALPHSEVYYSDNDIIPRFIREDFPMLCLPSRRGVEKVVKLLGAQRLDGNVISLNSFSQRADTSAFQDKLKQFHPYLLAFRLFAFYPEINDEKTQKVQANELKKKQIVLVSELRYSTPKRQMADLQDFEYLGQEDRYYMKVPAWIGQDSLLSNSNCCDALADIYASIFQVERMTDLFRSILRNRDFKDLEHQLRSRFNPSQIKRVMTLLEYGTADFFWKLFPKLKGQVQADGVDFLDLSTPTGIGLLAEASKYYDKNKVYEYFHSAIEKWAERELVCLKGRYNASFVWRRWEYLKEHPEKQNQYLMDLNGYANLRYKDLSCIAFTRKELEEALTVLCRSRWNVEIDPGSYDSVEPLYSVKKEEMDLFDEKERWRFYFSTQSEEEIRSMIDSKKKAEDEEILGDDADKQACPLMIVSDASCLESSPDRYSPTSSRNKLYRHGARQDRISRKKGELAQIEILRALNERGYEAKDISAQSLSAGSGDGYHADIIYRKRGSSEEDWRYLEAKSAESGRFILSAAELATAQSDEFKEIYDLAIYDGQKVRVFLKLHQYLTGGNGMRLYAKDYVVYFGTPAEEK